MRRIHKILYACLALALLLVPQASAGSTGNYVMFARTGAAVGEWSIAVDGTELVTLPAAGGFTVTRETTWNTCDGKNFHTTNEVMEFAWTSVLYGNSILAVNGDAVFEWGNLVFTGTYGWDWDTVTYIGDDTYIADLWLDVDGEFVGADLPLAEVLKDSGIPFKRDPDMTLAAITGHLHLAGTGVWRITMNQAECDDTAPVDVPDLEDILALLPGGDDETDQ